MLETYLNSSPLPVGMLLSGIGSTPAIIIAARTQAAKEALAAWQATWDELSREKEER